MARLSNEDPTGRKGVHTRASSVVAHRDLRRQIVYNNVQTRILFQSELPAAAAEDLMGLQTAGEALTSARTCDPRTNTTVPEITDNMSLNPLLVHSDFQSDCNYYRQLYIVDRQCPRGVSYRYTRSFMWSKLTTKSSLLSACSEIDDSLFLFDVVDKTNHFFETQYTAKCSDDSTLRAKVACSCDQRSPVTQHEVK